VNRTFTDGISITRETYFVWEDGYWRHSLTEEDKGVFMPGVPYEEFVAAQQPVRRSNRSPGRWRRTRSRGGRSYRIIP
jgi:hypothetical protein